MLEQRILLRADATRRLEEKNFAFEGMLQDAYRLNYSALCSSLLSLSLNTQISMIAAISSTKTAL
jgi:hypothetical protein